MTKFCDALRDLKRDIYRDNHLQIGVRVEKAEFPFCRCMVSAHMMAGQDKTADFK